MFLSTILTLHCVCNRVREDRMEQMNALLQRARRFRQRVKQQHRITRSRAARIFKVPIGTIRKVWPRLPFCRPVLVVQFPKFAGGSNPSTAVSAVQANFDPADLLTKEQLAKRLQVSTGWIREKTRRRNRNKLPSFSLGRYVRFYWPDVCRWLREGANQ